MSVRLDAYYGNVGNHMFQYFAVFLYSQIYDLYLETPMSLKMQKFIQMKKEPNEGKTNHVHETYEEVILTCEDMKGSTIRYEGPQKQYILKDYFQHSLLFNTYSHIILSYFEIIPETIPKWTLTNTMPSSQDVIVFIRLGDFIHQGYDSEIVHPSYVYNALQQMETLLSSINHIYMAIHPENDNLISSYMDYLCEYKSKIRMITSPVRNERFDFTIVKYFDNIIITNSTFNWWSIFFQDNLEYKRVYTPKYMGYLGIGKHKRCHGVHVHDLWNIRNMVHTLEHEFM